ncbi:hypothetical protein [Mucilaginibacter jinjuensis]|uniref:Uncharacterized protein n=1 Tax=Mucilaginibacter jinjuensis TaxID=1176721 RepID=A0ABY7T5P4_9SPHI|nr:hypothetical protein [Mucilaginibacter jinjuensis]WCT10582.1 hypothetical protein PQO05_17740 [Mucilaginibacter jinjuensis]
MNIEKPVKKKWLKPEVEIISVKGGFFPGNFEGTNTFTVTGHVVKNTYHS